jgi:hypothetical protein
MARMYPEEIEGYEKATEGEKKVFRFLREAARPHKDYRCWYEPSIGAQQKEPDIVWSPSFMMTRCTGLTDLLTTTVPFP